MVPPQQSVTHLNASTGDDVAQLQNYLREEGIMRGDDAYPGYYGEVTETAVVKWQQRHDLPATGAFGDLARETYIQKQVLLSGCVAQHVQELLSTQERRMQSTLSASDGISVLQDGSANHMPGGLAGSVLSGLLLAAATYAAVVQVRSWIERRQGDWLAGVTAMLPPFVAGWLGRAPAAPEPLFGEPLGDDAGMEALWNLPAAEPGTGGVHLVARLLMHCLELRTRVVAPGQPIHARLIAQCLSVLPPSPHLLLCSRPTAPTSVLVAWQRFARRSKVAVLRRGPPRWSCPPNPRGPEWSGRSGPRPPLQLPSQVRLSVLAGVCCSGCWDASRVLIRSIGYDS